MITAASPQRYTLYDYLMMKPAQYKRSKIGSR